VWGNQPATASYTPNAAYSDNWVGKPITITRVSTGTYTVRFSGLGGAGYVGTGNLKASAYGSWNTCGAVLCRISEWHTESTDIVVSVVCTTPNGAPLDSYFTLLYLGLVIG
jgi:hypothetical protein